LAIDSDKFFDELADNNELLLDEEIRTNQDNQSMKQRIKK